MNNKIVLGVFALLIVGIVGVGLVSAHGEDSGGYMMSGVTNEDYLGMHDAVDELVDSGSYEDLEALREEYNMPIMHWVDSEDDFEFAKEMHERVGDNYMGSGIGGMPCHG